MRTILIVAILFAVAGCASANGASLRDPAYANHAFTKVAVFAVGMRLDDPRVVETQLCDKLAPASCVSGQKLLAPTQLDSPTEISRSLALADVDGVLIIMLGDDQTASAYLASIVTGPSSSSSTQSRTASLYTNIAMWITPPPKLASQSAAPIPIYTYERSGHAIAGLIDRSSGKTAWGGQLNVTGQGEVSVSDKDFIRAATNELAAQLMDNHLIRIPTAHSPQR